MSDPLRVRYLYDGDNGRLIVGVSPKHWGLGFLIEWGEFHLSLGPFFVGWVR